MSAFCCSTSSYIHDSPPRPGSGSPNLEIYGSTSIHKHNKFGWVLFLVGGWPTPLKNMSSSVGMMKFPMYGKIKLMFQTTRVRFFFSFAILAVWFETAVRASIAHPTIRSQLSMLAAWALRAATFHLAMRTRVADCTSADRVLSMWASVACCTVPLEVAMGAATAMDTMKPGISMRTGLAAAAPILSQVMLAKDPLSPISFSFCLRVGCGYSRTPKLHLKAQPVPSAANCAFWNQLLKFLQQALQELQCRLDPWVHQIQMLQTPKHHFS